MKKTYKKNNVDFFVKYYIQNHNNINEFERILNIRRLEMKIKRMNLSRSI